VAGYKSTTAHILGWSQFSSGSIVTRLRVGLRGVGIGVRPGARGSEPAAHFSQSVPQRESKHLFLSGAEVKTAWIYTSTAAYIFTAYKHTVLRNFRLTHVEKIEITGVLKGASNFLLAGVKAQETKVAEEYCWAITQAAGRSCCGLSSSSVLEFECFLHTQLTESVLKLRVALNPTGPRAFWNLNT
jgi:hypothetical protein